MMRNNILLLALACLSWGCTGGVRKDKLEDAFGRDPYEFLAERLSGARGVVGNRRVAVLPFSYTDNRASDDGVVVSERLLTRIIQEGKLEVVERNLLEKVMGELKIQYSGAIDETSMKSLGKILGVEAVVTGTLTRQGGGMLEINARLIKAETAVVLAASVAKAPVDWESRAAEPAPGPEPAVGQGPLAAAGPAARPDDGFPRAWKFRENLRVAEKGGVSLVDYQVLVKFDSAAPIRAGRMRPDCGDLLFVNSNETSRLNYWLEGGCGTPEARAWVRLPFIAKNSVKNIYMYYGNPAASGESSGENTFLFFDDFNDGALDAAKWTPVRGDCSFAEAGGRLEFTGCSHGSSARKTGLMAAPGLRAPYMVELDGMSPDAGANGMRRDVLLRWDGGLHGPYNGPVNAMEINFYDGITAATTHEDRAGAVGAKQFVDGKAPADKISVKKPLTPGTWRHYRVADEGSKVRAYWGESELLSLPVSDSKGDRLGLSAREYPSGAKVYYDNIRVRRLASAEPAVYFYKAGGEGAAWHKYRSAR